jgi:hypothetical protein
MDSTWRAEAVDPSKFTTTAITNKVQAMANLRPYSDVEDIYEALQDYWANHRKRGLGPGPIKARKLRAEELTPN